jgi:hypothetical protein
MTDSWRQILERAAANLSIELDGNAPAGVSHPGGWPPPVRALRRSRSLAESRDLLARELEVISAQTPAPARQRVRQNAAARPAKRQSLNQAVLPREIDPPQPPGTGRSDRGLAALAISVAIVVFAIASIYALLH